MRPKIIFTSFLCIVLLIAPAAFSQDYAADTAKINQLLVQSREQFSIDISEAKKLSEEAKMLSEKIGYKKGVAKALKNIGTALFIQKNTSEGLAVWEKALKMFEDIKDSTGIADMLGNIGIYHYKQGDNVSAISYYLQALKIAEKIGYKKVMVSSLNNIGGIYYFNTSTYDKALKYYLQAQPIAEEINDPNAGYISLNIGNIYLKKDDFEKALVQLNKAVKLFQSNPANLASAYNSLGDLYHEKKEEAVALNYFSKGYDLATKSENQSDLLKSLLGISEIKLNQQQPKEALNFLLQAETILDETESRVDAASVYEKLSTAYNKLSDFRNAYKYQSLYANLKDTLYNAEYDKKVATLQFDFDLEKKENKITLLTKDKALQEADLKRQKLAKNAFMVGLILIVFIAFIIFRNYRQKVKINKVLDRQKEEIEGLLLNILPSEVANELQTTGKATPKSYQHASVLFSDFKGFTTIADKLSPEVLVQELNDCFSAFDTIIEKHGLEKIKTIGDSYMCAGNVPTSDPHHSFNIVKAGLEIQEWIYTNNENRKARGLESWEIRIGVHVGPVVAGVVGKKKYAYDIWGSTVNIASRMESSGVPGHLNISAATYELIKDKFACIYRGKIHAKNVGDIDMYLVDHEKETDGDDVQFKARKMGEKNVILPG